MSRDDVVAMCEVGLQDDSSSNLSVNRYNNKVCIRAK